MLERHRAAWIGATVVAASLTLVGCSGGGASDSARSAADTVVSASYTLDYAKAASVACQKTKSYTNRGRLAAFGLPPEDAGDITNLQDHFVSSTMTSDTSYKVEYASEYDLTFDNGTGQGKYTQHLAGVESQSPW